MIRASALYIVIIIALVIGLLCSALIVAAYFYKNQYQRKFRYDQLENNMGSGINILLASSDTSYTEEKSFSLFNNELDSVALKRSDWGVYDVGTVKAFIQHDTLYRVFSLANNIDSSKWAALYLTDQDRPFSVSGKTSIRGDAYIPKADVQTAYVDGKAYNGDKRLIAGTKHNSEKKLPPLDEKKIDQLKKYLETSGGDTLFVPKDSVSHSFLQPVRVFNFKKKVVTIENTILAGNIILRSDTTVTIESTAVLKNIQIYAKAIIVKAGFQGNCQLFATDSIRVEPGCRFDYPSCVGILRLASPMVSFQSSISIGENTVFNGLIFSYEQVESQIKPLIILEKNVKISGQVYAQGILQLMDNTLINGSVFTGRFLYKNAFTLFENYLINATINSTALSPYYLTSKLLPVSGKKKKILQWLQAN